MINTASLVEVEVSPHNKQMGEVGYEGRAISSYYTVLTHAVYVAPLSTLGHRVEVVANAPLHAVKVT